MFTGISCIRGEQRRCQRVGRVHTVYALARPELKLRSKSHVGSIAPTSIMRSPRRSQTTTLRGPEHLVDGAGLKIALGTYIGIVPPVTSMPQPSTGPIVTLPSESTDQPGLVAISHRKPDGSAK